MALKKGDRVRRKSDGKLGTIRFITGDDPAHDLMNVQGDDGGTGWSSIPIDSCEPIQTDLSKLFTQKDLDEAREEGRQEVIDDPEGYDLWHYDKRDEFIEEGEQNVKDDPRCYDLYDEDDYNENYQSGVDYVQEYPGEYDLMEVYGYEMDEKLDDAKAEREQEIMDDPETYGLMKKPEVPTAIEVNGSGWRA